MSTRLPSPVVSSSTATPVVVDAGVAPARRGFWRLALSQAPVRVGLVATLLVIFVALVGPWIAPHESTALVGPTYGSPAAGAPLGHDFLGHDVLSRVLAGGGSVVWMSLTTSILALGLGTVLGVLAAYARGRVDQAIVWAADVFLAFPDLILVLLIVSMLGRSHGIVVLTVALAFVPGVIRLARGVALNVARQEFVEAAELLGYPRSRIVLREILPNIATPLLVHLGVMLTWAVGMLSGLAFLGYGVAPPAADWGLMINENRAGLLVQPLAVAAPVLLVAVFALGTNLLAEGASRAAARIEER